MITSTAANYGKVLFSLGLREENIQNTKEILLKNSELLQVLENPSIKKSQKEAVIDTLFAKEICGFVKLLSANQCINIVNMIFEEYDNILLNSKNIMKAKLAYVTKPDETELGQIKDMICNKYNRAGVSLELQEDTSLIGGYVLMVGDTVYDKSIKGTLDELQKTLTRR